MEVGQRPVLNTFEAVWHTFRTQSESIPKQIAQNSRMKVWGPRTSDWEFRQFRVPTLQFSLSGNALELWRGLASIWTDRGMINIILVLALDPRICST